MSISIGGMMQRSLIIALPMFLAVAVGLGWYVHAFNTSGADASAYMAGYMLPLLCVAGAGVWFWTRKKISWTSQDRFATTLLIAAALAVVLHWGKISETYHARQMVGALTTAKTSEDAMKSLTSMDGAFGRLVARVNEMNLATHNEASLVINDIEVASGILGDAYFETIQNRDRLRVANEKLTQLVGKARDGEGKVKAAFEKLRREAKTAIDQSGLGSTLQTSFWKGLDESTNDWGAWYQRRITYTQRSVQAMLDLQQFVTAQNGQYLVEGQVVRFRDTATAQRYNELTNAIRALEIEGAKLDGERDGIVMKYEGRLQSFQALYGKQ